MSRRVASEGIRKDLWTAATVIHSLDQLCRKLRPGACSAELIKQTG
jgi:hypothetical protein